MSGVADIAMIAQVGPERGRHFEGEREAEVGGQVALVDLVEDDEADAGQLGSCWSRRVSTPSVTTSMRVSATDAALVAGLVADSRRRRRR